MDGKHDSSTGTRTRAPGEFFGLERELWDDRDSGQRVAAYLALLDRTARVLVQRARQAPDAEEAARIAALQQAVSSGRSVLLASRDAIAALARGRPQVPV